MEMEEEGAINGQVVETEHPVWGGKVITDLSVAFNFTDKKLLSD
jgi:iron complex outermembrane receptor protein